ncbi:MAG TPA: lysophospholipid acyltransferase family protein [Fimbriimonadaceae bacterium]|nr:lysophospholipid acyltransferase family protein [Fimbriimonadaceae bacterium]
MNSDRQTTLFRWLGLPFARLASWLLFTLLGPTVVRHRSRVPKEGGLLILANHQADVDPILVQIACPRPIYFMAKSELFSMPILGYVIRCFKAFPVKRGEPDRSAIKHAVELVKSGEVVCVFPEGELSPTGEMLPLKPGVALLIRLAQCPVVCVGLKNTNRIMPYGKVIPRPSLRLVSATWGNPLQLDAHANVDSTMHAIETELRSLTA